MKNAITIIFLIGVISSGVWARMAEDSNRAALLRSYAKESKQDLDGAIRELIPAYNRDPKNFFLNLRLGWLSYLKGDQKDAGAHYDHAILLEPLSVTARLGKINVLMAKGQWDEAESRARSLERELPGNLEVRKKLIHLLLGRKEYDRARLAIDSAIPLFPEDTELWNAKASAFAAKGKRK